MNEIIYYDDGNFFLLDYSPSHSELIIRTIKKGQDFVNHDIFFKGVSFLNIATRFEGISIKEENMTEYFKSNLIEGYKNTMDKKLFSITDVDQNKYYISAYFFCVFQNKLDIIESPLGDKLWSDINKKLFIYK